MLNSRINLTSSKAWRTSGSGFYANGQNSDKNFQKKTSQVLVFCSSTKWKTHFEASKLTNKLMVIEFTASWCVPCRYMDKVMNEFATKYTDVEFVKIDVDEVLGVSSAFGVQTLPTSILIKKGNVVDKITGVKIEELQKKIEKYRAYTYYCHQ